MLRTALGALAAVVVAVGMASPARADKDEFSRPGCYVGASGSYSIPYGAERELEDPSELPYVFIRTFGPVDAKVENSWTASGRAGCRNRWIGGELHFEWIGGFDGDVRIAELRESTVAGWGLTVDPRYYYRLMPGTEGEIDGWALTADAKFYPFSIPFLSFFTLKGRMQPFATLGLGYLKLDGKFDYGPVPIYRDMPAAPNPPVTEADLEFVRNVDGNVRHVDDWDFVVRAGGGLEIYVTKHVAFTLDAVVAIPTSQELRGFRYFTTGGGLIYRF